MLQTSPGQGRESFCSVEWCRKGGRQGHCCPSPLWDKFTSISAPKRNVPLGTTWCEHANLGSGCFLPDYTRVVKSLQLFLAKGFEEQ